MRQDDNNFPSLKLCKNFEMFPFLTGFKVFKCLECFVVMVNFVLKNKSTKLNSQKNMRMENVANEMLNLEAQIFSQTGLFF